MSEYRSRSGEFNRFMESTIYRDMVYDIKLQISQVIDMLRKGDDEESDGKMVNATRVAYLRGALDALEEFEEMPKRILQNIIDDEERSST